MGNRIIKINEHFQPEGGLHGEMIFGNGLHREEFINPFGVRDFRMKFEEVLYKDHNIVPIGGYQFAFSKLFNIALDQDTTLRVGDLNDEAPQMKIGVARQNYISPKYNAEIPSDPGDDKRLYMNEGVMISAMNSVFGFMIGNGGCKEDNKTAIAPNYKNRTLYHAVPFRMSNDGTKIPPYTYYGKAETDAATSGQNQISSWFVKKFDSPKPHIIHAWVTDNEDEQSYIDDTIFSSTSTKGIESYVEINLSVSLDDARGYFDSANTTPSISEFALVSGWYNRNEDDYESIRMFTHFTRPALTLTASDKIQAIYRLYAR